MSTKIAQLKTWIGLSIIPVLMFLPALLGRIFDYGDALVYFYNITRAYQDAWTKGAIFWNDAMLSGYPTLSNPQIGIFYPFNLPLLLLDPLFGLSFQIVFHGYVLACGVYFYAKARGVDWWGSVLLSASVSSCGTFASLVTMTNNWMAVSWIPWVLHFRYNLKSRSGKLGFFLCLHFFLGAGEPQLAFFAYPILLVLLWMELPRKEFYTGGILMILSGTSQPWLFSFIEGILRSTRQMGFVSLQNLPWKVGLPELFTIWIPSGIFRMETLMGWVDLNGGHARPNWLFSLYTGSIPLSLAGLGFARLAFPSRILVAGLLFGVWVATTGGIPFTGITWDALPFLNLLRFPIRFWILIQVTLFTLMVHGAISLREESYSQLRMRVWVILAIQLVLMSCLYIFHPFRSFSKSAEFPFWESAVGVQFYFELILLLALGLFVVVLKNVQQLRRGVYVLFAVAAAWSMWMAAAQMDYGDIVTVRQPTLYKSMGFESNSLEFVNERRDLSADSATLAQKNEWLRSIRKSDISLMHMVDQGQALTQPMMSISGVRTWGTTIELIPRTVQGYLQFVVRARGDSLTNLLWYLGADNYLGDPIVGKDLKQIPERSVLRSVLLDRSTLLGRWRLPEPMPMVSILDTTIPDGDYNRMQSWKPDVQGSLAITQGESCSGGRGGRVDFQRSSTDRWTANVNGRKGFLVLRQANYPGWKIYLDGVPSRPISVDLLYGGVCLDGRASKVEFRFRPRFLLLSFVVVLVSVIGLGTLLWLDDDDWGHLDAT